MLLLPLSLFVGLLVGGPKLGQDESAVRWPIQLEEPAWKPHIGYLRQATAIAGQPLRGPELKWNGAKGSVNWTLLDAPAGMSIDDSKHIRWTNPVEGGYLVHAQAELKGETEQAEWLLTVVKTDVPNLVIYSTRHVDYLVPKAYADWMERSGAHNVVDGYYEFGRDLLGCVPEARQSLLYSRTLGGAHNGIPIVAGEGTFGDSDVTRWKLGFLFHEFGHNLNVYMRVGYIEGGDALVDTTLHGMVEFEKMAWVYRMLKSPETQGVSDVPNFVEWMKAESNEFVEYYLRYLKEVPSGAEFFTCKEGSPGVMAGFVHEYTRVYGPEAIEKCLRVLRMDGIAIEDYPPKGNSKDRMSILLCIMAVAAGQDMREEFHAKKLPLNDAVYLRFNPIVEKAMAHLPALGQNGAIECPVDGHYYLTTPHRVSWADAEATARRMGGHLATIRSLAQEQWLATKYFGQYGSVWLGCTRNNANNSWNWVTREETPQPLWQPGQPQTAPEKICGVLSNTEEEGRPSQCGMANCSPDEHRAGLIELDHPPVLDEDSLP